MRCHIEPPTNIRKQFVESIIHMVMKILAIFIKSSCKQKVDSRLILRCGFLKGIWMTMFNQGLWGWCYDYEMIGHEFWGWQRIENIAGL